MVGGGEGGIHEEQFMRTERTVAWEPYNRDCACANGCPFLGEGLDVVMPRCLLYSAIFFRGGGGREL